MHKFCRCVVVSSTALDTDTNTLRCIVFWPMQVTADAFAITRKGGEVLFKLPLDCLLTAAQPNPTSVEVQVGPGHVSKVSLPLCTTPLIFLRQPFTTMPLVMHVYIAAKKQPVQR